MINIPIVNITDTLDTETINGNNTTSITTTNLNSNITSTSSTINKVNLYNNCNGTVNTSSLSITHNTFNNNISCNGISSSQCVFRSITIYLNNDSTRVDTINCMAIYSGNAFTILNGYSKVIDKNSTGITGISFIDNSLGNITYNMFVMAEYITNNCIYECSFQRGLKIYLPTGNSASATNITSLSPRYGRFVFTHGRLNTESLS